MVLCLIKDMLMNRFFDVSLLFFAFGVVTATNFIHFQHFFCFFVLCFIVRWPRLLIIVELLSCCIVGFTSFFLF